jgi:SPP1 family predicted phage head-tail adaptor
MDIGSFNKLVAYQRRAPGTDDHGQPNGAWVTEFKRWTNIRNQSGAEVLRGGAETSVVRCSLRVLNCPGTIDNSMRGVLGVIVEDEVIGKIYEIQAVLPDDVDQQHTDLVCTVAV